MAIPERRGSDIGYAPLNRVPTGCIQSGRSGAVYLPLPNDADLSPRVPMTNELLNPLSAHVRYHFADG